MWQSNANEFNSAFFITLCLIIDVVEPLLVLVSYPPFCFVVIIIIS